MGHWSDLLLPIVNAVLVNPGKEDVHNGLNNADREVNDPLMSELTARD